MNRQLFWLTLLLAGSLFGATLRAETGAGDLPASSLAPDATLTPREPVVQLTSDKSAPAGSQLTLYFVGLLALAGGGFYLLKRGLPLRGKRVGEHQLQVLETKMLGNRQFLVVVKYQDSKMLLGVGPGQIQLLTSLDSADDDLERLASQGGTDFGAEAV